MLKLAISDVKMQPQPPADRPSDDRFRHRLDPLIDRRHELVRLATLEELALAKRPLAQQRQDNNKRYALQAPEVECIATGKVPKRFDPTW